MARARVIRQKTVEETRELYFRWLTDQIDRRRQDPTQRAIARLLFETEFYDIVAHDDNRVEDGKKLREKFINEEEVYPNTIECLDGPCSMLEMLLALAKRIEDLHYDRRAGNQRAKWFWEMVNNLKLRPFHYKDPAEIKVRLENIKKIDAFLKREYEPNGKGGIFPLKNPSKDQRDVELWYQLMEYLDENYPDI